MITKAPTLNFVVQHLLGGKKALIGGGRSHAFLRLVAEVCGGEVELDRVPRFYLTTP